MLRHVERRGQWGLSVDWWGCAGLPLSAQPWSQSRKRPPLQGLTFQKPCVCPAFLRSHLLWSKGSSMPRGKHLFLGIPGVVEHDDMGGGNRMENG